ncbi:MAG TPA: patatin-like phospholipase family protein [Candidatus Nitrosocosmicus sp.]|nr:patatin-like phospholipase family protein [Candidatus Nitrosocosmicus sp.]
MGNAYKNQIQRALILQGGGALGAYEAGIYEALYEQLIDQSLKEGRQLFDIVAGTSAGAINATIIVNHVSQSKMNKDNPWLGSVQKLKKFWEDISTHTFYFEDFYTRPWLKAASELRNEYVQF